MRKLSKWLVRSWVWTVSFDLDDREDGGSGYFVTLSKCHPVWEAVDQVISHFFPDAITMIITESDWYDRMQDQYTMEVMALPIEDQDAFVLCRPMWEALTGPEGIVTQNEAEDE